MAQRRILHKLYLTAFWLLAAFALVVSGVEASAQVSGYRRDQDWRSRAVPVSSERPTGTSPVDVNDRIAARRAELLAAGGTSVGVGGRRRVLSPEEAVELGLEPAPVRVSGWARLGEFAAISGASLIPLLLLVAARRWVLWLMRPEVEPRAEAEPN